MRTGMGLRSSTQTFLLVFLLLFPGAARAMPSFAEQTGQPCAACHVAAFGPQLTKFGRDFKLNGYTAGDEKKHGLPLAVTTQLSFTHTNNPQPGPAAPHFAPNDNVAIDQASLHYAGRIAPGFGAFVHVTYDGIAEQLHLDNADVRCAHDTELFDQDLIYDFTVNNSPTVSDLWNSTPVWGFPYNHSPLAPSPMAAALIDGGLGQRVAGVLRRRHLGGDTGRPGRWLAVQRQYRGTGALPAPHARDQLPTPDAVVSEPLCATHQRGCAGCDVAACQTVFRHRGRGHSRPVAPLADRRLRRDLGAHRRPAPTGTGCSRTIRW
jgi:hypothetical protein